MTQYGGIVLTGNDDGQHKECDHEYLVLPQPVMPWDSIEQPIQRIMDSIIQYRHIRFEWFDSATNKRTSQGYWVPINDETRRIAHEPALMRQWVLFHLSKAYIDARKMPVDNSAQPV